MVKAPPELTNSIVQNIRIPRGRSGGGVKLSELAYGIGCIGIIAILALAGFSNNHIESGVSSRLAANTIVLADQLTCGARLVFTGQK